MASRQEAHCVAPPGGLASRRKARHAPEGYPRGFQAACGGNMTVCPIAIVAGCAKCPAVSVCPLKTVLGDAPKPGDKPPPKP